MGLILSGRTEQRQALREKNDFPSIYDSALESISDEGWIPSAIDCVGRLATACLAV